MLFDTAKSRCNKGLFELAYEIYCDTLNGHLEVVKIVNYAGGRELVMTYNDCSSLHYVTCSDGVEIARCCWTCRW